MVRAPPPKDVQRLLNDRFEGSCVVCAPLLTSFAFSKQVRKYAIEPCYNGVLLSRSVVTLGSARLGMGTSVPNTA